MDIPAIRAALVALLADKGLNAYPTLVAAPVLPAVVVSVPSEITYRVTLRLDQLDIPLVVLASMAETDDAQARLDAALSRGTDGSIIDAVSDAIASPSGTAWQSIRCTGATNFRRVSIGQGEALAADLTLEIVA